MQNPQLLMIILKDVPITIWVIIEWERDFFFYVVFTEKKIWKW